MYNAYLSSISFADQAVFFALCHPNYFDTSLENTLH